MRPSSGGRPIGGAGLTAGIRRSRLVRGFEGRMWNRIGWVDLRKNIWKIAIFEGLTWGILWFMVDITIFTMETHHFSWENSLFLWWFSADFPFNQYIDGWIIVRSLEW